MREKIFSHRGGEENTLFSGEIELFVNKIEIYYLIVSLYLFSS